MFPFFRSAIWKMLAVKRSIYRNIADEKQVTGPNSSSTASSSSNGSGSSTLSSGTIIGIVVAAVLVVIASIAAACLYYRRGQRHSLPPLSSQALQSSQLLDEQKPNVGRRSSWWAESQAGRVNDWNENVRR
jgi:hypothetical protein